MNPFNARVRAILRREYLTRVRSRWFVFSTLGVPLLLAGLGWFSVWMVSGAGEGGRFPTVAVVDRSDRLAEAVVAELEVDSIAGRTAPELASLSEDELRPRLLASGLDAFLVLPPGLLTGEGSAAEADADEPGAEGDAREPAAEVRVLARGSVSPGTRRTLRDAVDRALVRARLEEAGLRGVDTRALLEEAELTFIGVSEEGARSQETVQIAAFVMALVFYGVLLFYGQMIVRSVVEEKTSDIVEVVVSSVRPWELMLGKIVGVGAVGLTQLTIWFLVGTLGLFYGLTGGAAALAEAGIDPLALAPEPAVAVGVLAFLVLGYLLYAGLFAGTGATLANEQDAQQAALPVVILIVVPFIAAQGVIENPATAWSVGLSLVPFFSPLLMPSRMLVMSVPIWELALAYLLLVGCILLVAWAAGRVYRVGILMKGQRPNLPELVRWVRHG